LADLNWINDFDPPKGTIMDIRSALQNDYEQYDGSRQRLLNALVSGADESTRTFSLARFLECAASRKQFDEPEHRILSGTSKAMGIEWNPHRNWIPFQLLRTPASGAVRAMGTIPGPKGGYLVGVDGIQPTDVLRGWSVISSAGINTMMGLQDGVVIPRTVTPIQASWIGENSPGISESPLTLGNVSLLPRTASAFVKFSIQLLRQGEAVESYLRGQLMAAVGELLDKAFFSGAGGAEPYGLLNTPGVNAQSGTSLAHAGILAMRRQVLAVGGRETSLHWVGTPAVQETMGARERATGGGRFLWDTDGILGLPTFATKNAPTGSLILGDFPQAVLGIFGPGVRIDIDPSQDFNTAGLVARVLLICDCAFPIPAAFSVAATVT
jgi:HK97 family phage major capsid protein